MPAAASLLPARPRCARAPAAVPRAPSLLEGTAPWLAWVSWSFFSQACREHTSAQQGRVFPGPSFLHCDPVPAGAGNPSSRSLAVLTHPLSPQQSKSCLLGFFNPAPSQKVLSVSLFQRIWATSGLAGAGAVHTEGLGGGCRQDGFLLQLK